ncbi:hypothetical protein ACUL41_00680 [Virgibacillus natechei]
MDYIDLVSKITNEPTQTSKRLIASILADRNKGSKKAHLSREPIQPIVTLERNEKQYYKPNEVVKKLGLSDQTMQREIEMRRPGFCIPRGYRWCGPGLMS